MDAVFVYINLKKNKLKKSLHTPMRKRKRDRKSCFGYKNSRGTEK